MPKKTKKDEKKKKKQISLPIFKTENDYYIVVKDKIEIKDAKILAKDYDAQIVTLEKYLNY